MACFGSAGLEDSGRAAGRGLLGLWRRGAAGALTGAGSAGTATHLARNRIGTSNCRLVERGLHSVTGGAGGSSVAVPRLRRLCLGAALRCRPTAGERPRLGRAVSVDCHTGGMRSASLGAGCADQARDRVRRRRNFLVVQGRPAGSPACGLGVFLSLRLMRIR